MQPMASEKGFSLMELMVTVTIVAILVSQAVPIFTRYLLTAKRSEAEQQLLNWANNQEIWRATHSTYADGTLQPDGTQLPIPTHAKYIFFVRATASNPPVIGDCASTAPTADTYVLLACPQSDQANDTENGVACNPLTLNQSNAKTPTECWQ